MNGSSFIFYGSFHEATKELNDAEYGALMRAINEYALNAVMPELKGVLKMAFLLIKPQIDANMERREASKNAGRPSISDDIKNEIIQELQNGETQKSIAEKYDIAQSTVSNIKNEISKITIFDNDEYQKSNVNVNVNDNVNVNGNVNVNENGNDNGNVKESSPPRSGGRSPESKSAPHPKKTDSESTRLAELLFTLHKKYDRQYNPPQKHIETWAEDIEKLHRIDKREYPDIERVIRWVKSDGNFWFSNIMSGSKLREQFSRLCVQMSQGNPNRQGRGSAVDKSGVDKVDVDDVDIPF